MVFQKMNRIECPQHLKTKKINYSFLLYSINILLKFILRGYWNDLEWLNFNQMVAGPSQEVERVMIIVNEDVIMIY